MSFIEVTPPIDHLWQLEIWSLAFVLSALTNSELERRAKRPTDLTDTNAGKLESSLGSYW